MKNQRKTMTRVNDNRVVRGTMAVAAITLLAGLPLDSVAVADEPLQIVAVSGKVACTDFSKPLVNGVEIKISGDGLIPDALITGVVPVTTVDIDVYNGQQKLDFTVTQGANIDVVVIKGAKDAQQYAFTGADFSIGLRTASLQKIQSVVICSDGTDVAFPNDPVPACNVTDNRDSPQGSNSCTGDDDAQGTIQYKIATKDDPETGVVKGQTFFCQCGDAQLETVEDSVVGELTQFESLGVVSINPTCIVWSKVGGTKECVFP